MQTDSSSCLVATTSFFEGFGLLNILFPLIEILDTASQNLYFQFLHVICCHLPISLVVLLTSVSTYILFLQFYLSAFNVNGQTSLIFVFYVIYHISKLTLTRGNKSLRLKQNADLEYCFFFFLYRIWKYSCLDLPRRSMPVANVEELYQSTKCVAQKIHREERRDLKK